MDQSISGVVLGVASMEAEKTKEIPTLGELWRPLSHFGPVFLGTTGRSMFDFCSRIQLPHFSWWFHYIVAFKLSFNLFLCGKVVNSTNVYKQHVPILGKLECEIDPDLPPANRLLVGSGNHLVKLWGGFRFNHFAAALNQNKGWTRSIK